MRRLGYVLVSLVLAMSLTGTTAMADIEWCAEDPIIDVLGARFDLTTQVGSSAASVSRIVYVVEVPSNANKVRVRYPAGDALAAVTEVEIQKTGKPLAPGQREFEVRATVTVTAPSGSPVILTSGGRSAAPESESGTANEPVKLTFAVRRGA